MTLMFVSFSLESISCVGDCQFIITHVYHLPLTYSEVFTVGITNIYTGGWEDHSAVAIYHTLLHCCWFGISIGMVNRRIIVMWVGLEHTTVCHGSQCNVCLGPYQEKGLLSGSTWLREGRWSFHCLESGLLPALLTPSKSGTAASRIWISCYPSPQIDGGKLPLCYACVGEWLFPVASVYVYMSVQVVKKGPVLCFRSVLLFG